MGSESRQVTILTDLVGLLGASGKPTGLNVLLDPPGMVWQGSLPACGVYPAPNTNGDSETVDHPRMGSNRVRRSLFFRTELRAVVDPEESGVAIIDPIYVWVVEQLGAAGSIDGVVRGPHELSSADGWLEQGEHSIKVKAVGWSLEYETLRNDPTEAP